MEYERLIDLVNELHAVLEYGDYCRLYDAATDLGDKYNETKDKIEDGTLVKLPYKLNDTVWSIYNNRDVVETTVAKISIKDVDGIADLFLSLDCPRHNDVKSIERKINSVFRTRELAETRLKELRGENE